MSRETFFWFLRKDGHLGLGKRSGEWAEQTRGRGGEGRVFSKTSRRPRAWATWLEPS